IPARIRTLREFGKPVVCNEDTKTGEVGAKAAELCVAAGGSWGLLLEEKNQHYPFVFRGAADDITGYAPIKKLTGPAGSRQTIRGRLLRTLSRPFALPLAVVAWFMIPIAAPAADGISVRGEVTDSTTGKAVACRIYIEGEDGTWHFPKSEVRAGIAVEYRRE